MTTGRRNAIVALLAGIALLGGLLAAPAIAEEGPAELAATPPQAVGLIVEYADDVPVREAPGEPTGASSVTVADLEVGRALTEELRTVEFAQPATALVAEIAALQMEMDPNVVFAEPDWVITLDATDGRVSSRATQASATWGLDRIDQRSGTNGTYSYQTTGSGVDVYVVDSGIRSTHQEFTGRIRSGVSYISTGGTEDCDGHGTHVSGTIAGTTYGVAKNATLIPVRVFDCSGDTSSSTVIAALAWIRQDHTGARPGVVNMSLGGSFNASLNSAVQATVDDGLVVVVAAGNGDANYQPLPSCSQSPASAPAAITVNASTSLDAAASFSNYGSCSDLYAPGQSITSAWITSNTASAIISGTSMAAPHVAGVAARILEANPAATPAQVWARIDAATTPISFTSQPGDPAKLLYADPLDATPGTPGSLAAVADYEALNVTWTAPSGSVPDHYEVEHSVNGATWVVDDTVSTTSTTIDGLDPTQAYLVRVRGVRGVNLGAWATATAAQPLAPRAPDAPGTPTLLAVDDTSISVTWGAPTDTGGRPLLWYSVEYSADGTTWTPDDTTVSNSTFIDGLLDDSTYSVRVRAVNAIGPSSPTTSSSGLSPRVITVPSAPQNLAVTTGVQSLSVTWSPPLDDGGRAITSYTVERSSDNATWTTLTSTSSTSTTIGGLTGGQLTYVRVAATNTVGAGPWATTSGTPSSPATPPPSGGGGGGGVGGGAPPAPPPPTITAPGVPALTAVTPGNASVSAVWRASDDTGGEVPGEFTVELDGPAGIVTATSSVQSIDFSDLQNGAEYRLRVAATNSAGASDFSPWSGTVIPIGPATAPTGLLGEAFDGGVSLQWQPPDDTGGSAIEDYVVQWISSGVEVTLTTASTSTRLETLANGTRYEFRVAAKTAAGLGQWSSPLTLTPRAAPVTAPQRLSLERTGRMMTVTWSAPRAGDPLRYAVATSINGSPYRIVRSTQSTRVVLSLSKGTKTIGVRVLAIDSYGRGPWSAPATERIRR